MTDQTNSIDPSPRRSEERDAVTRQGSTGEEGANRQQRLTIRLKSDDLRQLEDTARQCGFSTAKQSGVSAHVRQIALGYTPSSMLDQEVIIRLCDLHGRLGRVGGLFKLAIDENDDPAMELRAGELSALGAEVKELVRDIRAGDNPRNAPASRPQDTEARNGRSCFAFPTVFPRLLPPLRSAWQNHGMDLREGLAGAGGAAPRACKGFPVQSFPTVLSQ